jgi:signal transduction histidine kinase/ligand-binding sensor domain-containing protein
MRRVILKRKITYLILIVFATVASLSSVNFPVDAETPPFKRYTMSDGLAHDRVERVVRDSRGFLWFCTAEGLSRFDGYEFKNYTQDDGLPHRVVRVFLETRDGKFWLGTGDGIVRFDPRGTSARDTHGNTSSVPMFRTARLPTLPNGDPAAANDLIQDRNGIIWIAAANGVYRLDDAESMEIKRFEIPAAIENKNVDFSRLLEDHTGAIWAATEYGLYRISSDRTSVAKVHASMRVGSMIEDREHRIWLGSVGGGADEVGLHIYTVDGGDPAKVRTFRMSDGLPGETWFNALLETTDGRIIVGIGNALCEFLPDAPAGQSQFKVLSTEGVVALGEDVAGNIWMTTNSSGVKRLARGGFTVYNEADNLAAKRIISIIPASDGHLYVLADSMGIHRFDGKAFVLVKPLGAIQQSWGRGGVTFRSRTGEWWITGNQGLQRYPAIERLEDLAHTQPLKVYTTEDGLFSNVVFQVFEDSFGDIWISGIGHPTETLSRWNRATDTIEQFGAEQYGVLRANPVSAFGEDREGNIWLGHYAGGLARYRRSTGKFQNFGAAENLPSGFIANTFTDSIGRVWVATYSGGVVRIDDPTAESPKLTPVTTRDGLSSNQANCTTEDNYGRIYVGTGRGVNELDPRSGRIKVYTTADGLPDNIVTHCKRDSAGSVWFGTWSGIAKYEPKSGEQTQAPPVFLSDLRINGEPFRNLSQLGESAIEGLDLASDQRQIQIDFLALGFGVGESLRYQYKLDGVDPEWSEPSTQRTVNLNLSPGSYSFLVRAINAEGIISENPARLSFSIARPVWQQWWFLLIVATAIALAAYLVYRYRLAQLLKLERVRTRIASDLHDDIGSSLSQIAILSEVARHKAGDNGASEPLKRIAETSRDMVDSMSDIVWAINPQKDHLSDLIHRMRRFASDTFDSTDVGYRFTFDESTSDIAVGADLRREVYMIFKECINNTAKHSRADEVDIRVESTRDAIVVRVVDNGNGFDPDATLQGEYAGYGGNGLLNMRKRAERLGGKFTIESKPGNGTIVQFEVPTSGVASARNL